jgi:prepilin-type N-terminal cleavage/methylation domain-containing protein
MLNALRRSFNNSPGFTLLELLIATLISSLVIGILTVSLSFSLRIWERNRGALSGDQEIVHLLELLTLQLATFNPTPILVTEDKKPLFLGDEQSLTFATNYSVRALSHGVPVICRYLFIPAEQRLYYAELPFDPYHVKPIQEFLQMQPSGRGSKLRFYGTTMAVSEFSIGYQSKESGHRPDAWEDDSGLPLAVLVRISFRQGEKTVTLNKLINPRCLQFNAPETKWDIKKKEL